MRVVDIIIKKREKQELTQEEINFFITKYEVVPDRVNYTEISFFIGL